MKLLHLFKSVGSSVKGVFIPHTNQLQNQSTTEVETGNGPVKNGNEEDMGIGAVGGISGAIGLAQILIPQIVNVVEMIKGKGKGSEKKEAVMDVAPIIQIIAKQLGLEGKIPTELISDIIEHAVATMNKDKENKGNTPTPTPISSNSANKTVVMPDVPKGDANFDLEVQNEYWEQIVNYAKVVLLVDAKVKHYEGTAG